ncbi:ethanolamine ammonia-lyase reactivating factor EutA [Cryobacterium sp. N21]|uniref:ethanolamine ammonia-lyase reactivating factor EutA n=1 Tax=Cryobacterium sp. N21 TaxID=2048289 RepID=UPI0018ED3C93|nr:ethanolamine ammonia-lyase reactivating factor EutA [Cryobacterium sp. N21]
MDGQDLAIAFADNPIWQRDNVEMLSVGVDIGSAGTQVAFSRLVLRRKGEDLTSRYIVVERDTLYRSALHLTPFAADLTIDAARLGGLLDKAYAEAGLAPEDIDTGVVILTGEALRRENSEAIGTVIAERAGDVVCATAGHHMEAMLAAYGSGAVKSSHEGGLRVLNVDVGGGTTKLSLIESGQVRTTAALHVGGRLLAHEDGVITRLEPAGNVHAAQAARALALGETVTSDELDLIAEKMAETVFTLLQGGGDQQLWLTDPLVVEIESLDGLVFSGGVGEYVYHLETRDFGDLGLRLGHALRRHVDRLGLSLLEAAERIRATVLGASEYSVQLSGITTHHEDADVLLPRRNLQVIAPQYVLSDDPQCDVDALEIATAVRSRLAAFGIGPDDDIAVALIWSGFPTYQRLRSLAVGVRDGLAERIQQGLPTILVLNADVGLTLGRMLREELGVTSGLLVLDGLNLRDFDYVDLGRLRQPSGTVPVTIKSLVFGDRMIG